MPPVVLTQIPSFNTNIIYYANLVIITFLLKPILHHHQDNPKFTSLLSMSPHNVHFISYVSIYLAIFCFHVICICNIDKKQNVSHLGAFGHDASFA